MTTLTKPSRTALRVDIQVLRAFAVMGVVGFHLWPHVFVGGFVGVDVFFVISGYLITTHLVGEVFRHGTIRLGTFWARRARRLLPAAFLVILVTSALVFTFQPRAMWLQFVWQAVASVFYFENWALAGDATNYLAADKPPTAVQQFWSLSVEEQFYIVWPLLILLALAMTAITIRRRRKAVDSGFDGSLAPRIQRSFAVLVLVLALVVTASLTYSVIAVYQGEPVAYFSTFSRAWEFGAGGLLAVLAARHSFRIGELEANRASLPDRARARRRVVALAGWLGLVVSLWLINETTPFPGLAALLPVASTLCVIAARASASPASHYPGTLRWSASKLVACAVWIGGISYSVYLWHWPLIVIFPYAFGVEPSLLVKLAILALTIGVGWATKRWIEDPIRMWKILVSAPNWRTGIVALGAALIALVPSLWVGYAQTVDEEHRAIIEKTVAADSCFGAAFLENVQSCSTHVFPVLQPDPAVADQDRAALYDKNCITEESELVECTFGSKQAPFRIALVGDSHAASWFPALEAPIASGQVNVTTFTKFSCVFSDAPRSADYAPCTSWGEKLSRRLSGDDGFDLMIVVGYATNLREDVERGALSPEQATQGFLSVWKPVLERGTRIVVIRDNPEWPDAPALCLSKVTDATACDAPRSQFASQTDYQFLAATQIPGVDALDMTSYFCSDESCFTAIGGVTVYLDRSHLSATYARTLTDALSTELLARGIAIPVPEK